MIVVVTTCPRDGVSYLDETVRSLGAGAIVFNDAERMGSRWNTWRALACGARERLLLVQDDVIADPTLVDVAATMHIPDDVGVVSFHDCGDDFHWQKPPPGVHKFAAHRIGSHGLIGAQCLLFPPDQARWLSEQDMNAPPWPGPHAADTAIGWWTRRSRRPNKLVVTPALIRHVGEVSACWPDRIAAGASIPHAGRTFEDLIAQGVSPCP